MDHSAKLLWVLGLCVAVMAQQATALDLLKVNLIGGKETPTGKTLINKVCSASPTKDLCVQVLSSDALSTTANLKELAIISLRVAARNASGILADTKVLIDDDELDPDVQQGLADCKENILDAESQLEDTIAALMINSDGDAQLWLKAALAAIDTCDASIPGDDDILSVESAVFRKLCNIANLVIKQLANPTKS
ncbi:pectinesterase inhibitor-like [Vigna umbellata]|uniref:pectinesterase inhibitor-like n=1 Tax=Vigna umbellata TaxID=87088 RepID=UPI001F5E47DB|nr:pectinesterase inhibitor-like [Vigna umbellata]